MTYLVAAIIYLIIVAGIVRFFQVTDSWDDDARRMLRQAGKQRRSR